MLNKLYRSQATVCPIRSLILFFTKWSPSGRSSRSEFWWPWLWGIPFYLCSINSPCDSAIRTSWNILSTSLLWSCFCLMARRFHDISRKAYIPVLWLSSALILRLSALMCSESSVFESVYTISYVVCCISGFIVLCVGFRSSRLENNIWGGVPNVNPTWAASSRARGVVLFIVFACAYAFVCTFLRGHTFKGIDGWSLFKKQQLISSVMGVRFGVGGLDDARALGKSHGELHPTSSESKSEKWGTCYNVCVENNEDKFLSYNILEIKSDSRGCVYEIKGYCLMPSDPDALVHVTVQMLERKYGVKMKYTDCDLVSLWTCGCGELVDVNSRKLARYIIGVHKWSDKVIFYVRDWLLAEQCKEYFYSRGFGDVNKSFDNL